MAPNLPDRAAVLRLKTRGITGRQKYTKFTISESMIYMREDLTDDKKPLFNRAGPLL